VGEAYRRNDEPVRFIRRVPRHHAEHNLARAEKFLAFIFGYSFAIGREDGTHLHEVIFGDARIAQGHLERLQMLFVTPNPFCEKHSLGN